MGQMHDMAVGIRHLKSSDELSSPVISCKKGLVHILSEHKHFESNFSPDTECLIEQQRQSLLIK